MKKNSEVLAKIARPRNKNIYKRKRLFEKLNRLVETPAVWLSGPPGSGKTTLLASYAQYANRPCVWYQIDEGDADVANFFYYLRKAAGKIAPRDYTRLPDLTADYQGELEDFSRRFFEVLYDILPHGFIVVLDDYHLARNGNNGVHIDSAIASAVERLPEYGNIFLCSRETIPPKLCRLLGNDLLLPLGWGELRLSQQEAEGVARLRSPEIAEPHLKDIVAQADGWAAGLIFRAQFTSLASSESLPGDDDSHEFLFGYFASEVLDLQSDEIRHLMPRLAIMPVLTQDMACKLVGSAQAPALLNLLHRKNYFVSMQHLDVPTYRFHPMFREFLQARLEQEASAEEIQRLRERAAGLLEGGGYTDAAWDMYFASEAWSDAARLLIDQAADRVRHGRVRSLLTRIQRLPESVRAAEPWLMYWQGMCQMMTDTNAALESFSCSFEGFVADGQSTGALAAWSGAINAILGRWSSVAEIEHWVGRGEMLLPASASVPEDDIRAQATAAMCFAMFICRPQSPDLPLFTRNTHEILAISQNTSFALLGCNMMLIFYSWLGDLEKGRLLLEAVGKKLDMQSESDANRITWLAAKGWQDLVSGRPSQVLESVDEAQQYVTRSGCHALDYKLFGMAAQASMQLGRLEDAKIYLWKYRLVAPEDAQLIQFHLGFLTSQERWMSGDQETARRLLDKAMMHLDRSGSPPIVTAKIYLGRAVLHFDANKREQGHDCLGRAWRIARATGSAWLKYHCQLLEAEQARLVNDRDGCRCFLTDAFGVARRKGLTTTDWWDVQMMSRLCTVALAEGIEAEYVQELIAATGLQPVDESVEAADWPWPYKVEVCGNFRLEAKGQLVSARSGGQKKVLELLKCIIAMGGNNIRVDRLADVLWPEADGDGARNSLKTTVYRLRKMIGCNDVVRVRNGLVSLDEETCWTDLGAFYSLLESFPALDNVSNENLQRALDMIRGPLLVDDEEQPWMLGPRRKLAHRVHAVVMELGERQEAASQWRSAIETYRSGLQFDHTDEQVCRHLMHCYHSAGRDADAVAVFERCRIELELLDDRPPSGKTLSMVESITGA